jgi:hypothetical protein
VLVFLNRPSLIPVALKTNTEDVGGFDTNLQVTFPYPVEVCSSASSHFWQNQSGNTNGISPVATPATTNPVTATLSSGDTLLTLTYNLLSGSDDPGDDLRVYFYGVAVKPKGSSAGSCTPLTNVQVRNGAYVNTTIYVRTRGFRRGIADRGGAAASISAILPVVEDATDLSVDHVPGGKIGAHVRTIGRKHLSLARFVSDDDHFAVEKVESSDVSVGRGA